MYDSCPYTREHQPLMQQEEAGFGGGLMTIHVGSSLCRRAHQLQFAIPPSQVSSFHLSLIFLFPFQASSFTSTRSPGFQIQGAYFSVVVPISVGVLPCSIGPVPPTGCSSIGLLQKLHTHPHSWWRPLSWGPHCHQQWGRQSQPGA